MEKKLTAEQVEYIANYIESRDIKWYELQVELTDHMVSSMEELWAKDPELTFYQVKQYAEEKFGRNAFKAIEKERKPILQKEFDKKQRRMVADYLKFPKIVGSILFAFVAFKVSFYFDSPSKYLSVLFASSYIFGLPMIYLFHKNRKIKGKSFLTMESVNPFLIFIVFPNLGMSMISPMKEELNQYSVLMLAFCSLWVIGILFIISATYIQTKTVENIKKQYQLT
jgi:uncharacterized membrane protein